VIVAILCVAGADDVYQHKPDILSIERAYRALKVLPNVSKPIGTSKSATLEYPQYLGANIDTVGYTYYDMQHNYTCGRNIAVDEAGGVHIVWMWAEDATFGTRNIKYNYISPEDMLLSPPDMAGNAESSDRGGYTTIALTKLPALFDTSAAEIEVPVVAFHGVYNSLGSESHTDIVWDGYYRILGEGARGSFGGTESGSSLPGAGSMPNWAYSNSEQYEDYIPEHLDCPTVLDIQAIWPVVEADDEGNIYLASTPYVADTICGTGIPDWIVFHSGSPVYDASDWIQYYEFSEPLLLDMQNGINVDLAIDRNSGELAAIYNYVNSEESVDCPDSLWGSFYSMDLFYRITTDGGVTWSERQGIIEYNDELPTIDDLDTLIDPGVYYDTLPGGDTIYFAKADTQLVAYIPWWPTSVSGIYDENGVLHVAFQAWMFVYGEDNPFEEDPCYAYVRLGTAILYWNSADREIVPISRYASGNPSYITDTDGSSVLAYRHSIDPSIGIDDEGNLFIVWEQCFNLSYDFFESDTFLQWVYAHEGTLTTEEYEEYSAWVESVYVPTEGYLDVSAGGVANEDIYGVASRDGGNSWGTPYNISQTYSPGCAAGECLSELNITLAERVDDELHIFAVLDLDAGENLRDVGEVTENPIIHIPIPKDSLLMRAPDAIREARSDKPQNIAIGAYPNPFNANANIVWSSPVNGNGKVEILDITGRVINTLYNGFITSGSHTTVWDGTDNSGNPVPTGTYMCRVKVGDDIATSRITLVK